VGHAPSKRWLLRANRAVESGGVDAVKAAALILRGPLFGVPMRLRSAVLPCSVCFRLLPRMNEYFDLKTYRVEPVCKECKGREEPRYQG